MESKEAEGLRTAWGDKPCEHPWWVEETLRGRETGKVVCPTCGQDRRKSDPEPAPVKGKTTTDADKATTLNQQVTELDPKDITVIQQNKDLDALATPLNEKVKDLDSVAEGIVAMLRGDFAFTMQDEAKIASVMGKLRDALGRWRKRQREKRCST